MMCVCIESAGKGELLKTIIEYIMKYDSNQRHAIYEKFVTSEMGNDVKLDQCMLQSLNIENINEKYTFKNNKYLKQKEFYDFNLNLILGFLRDSQQL